MTVENLPTLNAILNGTAFCFLITGWFAIKAHKQKLHGILMITTLGISCIFLTSYLYYHFNVKLITHYEGEGISRFIYFFILITHIPLAGLVPPLAILAIWFAFKTQFERHKRVTKWLWPIWVYVSVTGVLIYLMLYIWK